eukprot:1369120-Prorocentrum_lima.AAC.1
MLQHHKKEKGETGLAVTHFDWMLRKCLKDRRYRKWRWNLAYSYIWPSIGYHSRHVSMQSWE